MINNRENNIKTLVASIIMIVVIAAFAVAGVLVFGGETVEKEKKNH